MSAFVREKKDSTLALALASGMSHKAAAEQFGVTDRTIRRKLNRPGFRRLLARIRNQLMSQALGRLTDHLNQAVDVLATTLQDESPTLRVRAARTLLTHAQKLRDSVEVSDRIHDLEEQLKSRLGVQTCPTQQN